MFGIRGGLRHDGEPRLDPVRWPGAVRRGWLIRAALVAVLLATAATTLYAAEPAPGGCAAPGATPPGGASPTSPRPSRGAASGTAGPAGVAPGAAPPAGMAPDAAPSAGVARLALPTGAVGVAVSLAEPVTLAVVRPGDRVDLLTVPAKAEPPVTVAGGALVLATAGGAPDAAPDAPGALYVALTPQQARRTIALQGRVGFAVVVRG
ncbi:MAG TPA: flagellar biosynthesis protein FlgA [Pilimelia sp.]|nr:flagellar biosynthesis protein FlgA [Pilimelia sp.]